MVKWFLLLSEPLEVGFADGGEEAGEEYYEEAPAEGIPAPDAPPAPPLPDHLN